MAHDIDNDASVPEVNLGAVAESSQPSNLGPNFTSPPPTASSSPPPSSPTTAPLDPSPLLQRAIQRLYHNTVALAPMVRAGTLPLRLLALEYGCNVVYGEEIIDRKLMQCVREVNSALGTIDFVTVTKSSGGGGGKGKEGGREKEVRRLVFQTVAREKECVIFQMGTRNPEWAVQAARIVQHDVAAIDLNMGCPKKFSLQDGMGAALLDHPSTASSLITALRLAFPHLPISCKIRLLDTDAHLPKTIEFALTMKSAGACALNVHMRTQEDKPADPARWELLKPLVSALDIPVIANGDLYTQEDVARIQQLSGCAGVMLARPVLYNPSVLRTLRCGEGGVVARREEEEEGGMANGSSSSSSSSTTLVTTTSSPSSSSSPSPPLPLSLPTTLLPLLEVIRAYLRLCLQYDSHVSNAKYVVLEMIVRRRHPDHIKPRLLPLDVPDGINVNTVSKAKTLQALAGLFGVVAEEEEGMGRGRGGAMEGLHHYSDAYFGVTVVEEEKEEGGGGVTKRREGGEEAGVDGEGGESCSKRHKVREDAAAGTQ